MKTDNAKLFEIAKDYTRVRGTLGEEQADSIVARDREAEKPLKRSGRIKNYRNER